MFLIEARNVNDALPKGLLRLDKLGKEEDSRVGSAIVMDGPVTTIYHKPTERVLFNATRDANPFFHLMESLWMLSGRNDLAWISQFIGGFERFSDDGRILYGAYGFRWMNSFQNNGEDHETKNQIDVIIKMLQKNPNTRRAVLQMWSAPLDLDRSGKDIPCNTHIYFSVSRLGCLDMTVCNRSNDAIWGAYGANVVHMSMLQEYIALSLGLPVGRYWQMSNNFHAYTDVFIKTKVILDEERTPDAYETEEVSPYPLMSIEKDSWDLELNMFMNEPEAFGFDDKFFRRVAVPMREAWFAWKDKENPYRIDAAIQTMSNCLATDWRKAGIEWLERRRK